MALKDSKEIVIPPMTRKQASRGKAMKLHKYWKGIASTILNKTSRRQYLNMMIDATMAEHEAKMKKRKEKDTGSDE